MKTIECKIFSDIICPWCLIGWTNLKQAQERLNGSIALDVQWLPYELNPAMPPGGMDRQDYLTTKFGGEQRATEIYGRIEQAATAAGVHVSFDKISRTPNSLMAHRLILRAGEHQRATQVKEALFQHYFVDGLDIGDVEVLIDTAVACGMDEEATRTYLLGDEGTEPVRAWEAEAGRLGISGVPFFIIDQKYGLSGAQPPDMFVRALTEIGEAD